eukprot:865058-Pelagomonas_calceolata.AAC.10
MVLWSSYLRSRGTSAADFGQCPVLLRRAVRESVLHNNKLYNFIFKPSRHVLAQIKMQMPGDRKGRTMNRQLGSQRKCHPVMILG